MPVSMQTHAACVNIMAAVVFKFVRTYIQSIFHVKKSARCQARAMCRLSVWWVEEISSFPSHSSLLLELYYGTL